MFLFDPVDQQASREEQEGRQADDNDPEGHIQEDVEEPAPEGSAYDRLYPGHIPSTLFQKSVLSVGMAFVAITAPWRGGESCVGVNRPVIFSFPDSRICGRSFLISVFFFFLNL